ncbi:MAG: EamA family transporter [Pseudomonadota bacterium]
MNAGSAALVFAALLSWSVLLVLSRVILLNFALDPWPFTFIQMMAAGIFLLTVSGRISGSSQQFRDPYIWIYGILRVGTAAFFTASLVYVSATNAAFLSILAVPTSAIVLWSVLGRKPGRWELPGHIVILLGLFSLAQVLEDGWRNPALIFMILSELCVVASTIIAELHPLNRTEDRRQRAGLTGIMLMVSAFVLLLVAIAIATLAQWFPDLQSAMPVEISWISTPNDIFEPTLWVAAIALGIFLRGPSMYLTLAAINRVQTANYIAAMAALPLTSLLLEQAAVAAGLLPPAEVWNAATLFGCVMISGSLAVLWARSRRRRQVVA